MCLKTLYFQSIWGLYLSPKFVNTINSHYLLLRKSGDHLVPSQMITRSWFTGVIQFSSVQSLSHVWLFETPWIAACQASLSITNSRSSLRLMSIESVMPSSHLILCHPLLLLPPIPPSIRVFSSESTLLMRWPNTRVSASASFPPKKSQGWSPSEWTG